MVDPLKVMSLEKKELAVMVAHMRDEVTKTRICMKTLMKQFAGTSLNAKALHKPSSIPIQTSMKSTSGKKSKIPSIPSVSTCPNPEMPLQQTVEEETIQQKAKQHGPLSSFSQSRETVTIIESATGKGCIHFCIKMMEDHQGGPPQTSLTLKQKRQG